MGQINCKYGKIILFDDEDYDEVMKHKWLGGKYSSAIIDGKKVSMHRFIMKCNDPKIRVDHINHNGLDNRRCNLRLATYKQNMANRLPSKNGTSKYLGVHKRGNYFRAQISLGKRKSKYLGSFKTEEEAAIAYNEAAKIVHGEFANLNVI